MSGTVTVTNSAGVSRATIEATLTRADGTVEHLGVIADSGPLFARPSLLNRLKDKLWPKV